MLVWFIPDSIAKIDLFFFFLCIIHKCRPLTLQYDVHLLFKPADFHGTPTELVQEQNQCFEGHLFLSFEQLDRQIKINLSQQG